jgi:hypothetical protein
MNTLLARQRVHADAVAEQRAARAAPRGVDRDHRHLAFREEAHQAAEELVGQRGLAGAAGAGDAHHRRTVQRLGRGLADLGGQRLVVAALEDGNRARDLLRVGGRQR